jgi:hypothetical protein
MIPQTVVVAATPVLPHNSAAEEHASCRVLRHKRSVVVRVQHSHRIHKTVARVAMLVVQDLVALRGGALPYVLIRHTRFVVTFVSTLPTTTPTAEPVATPVAVIKTAW